MPRIVFTKSLDRHLPRLPSIVAGDSGRAALEATFASWRLLCAVYVIKRGTSRISNDLDD